MLLASDFKVINIEYWGYIWNIWYFTEQAEDFDASLLLHHRNQWL